MGKQASLPGNNMSKIKGGEITFLRVLDVQGEGQEDDVSFKV